MEPTTIQYAAVTRQGEEYPEKYVLTLKVKFAGSVDDTAEIPATGLIVSSDLEGNELTVVSTHRLAQELYDDVVAHLKKHDIVRLGYKPPTLSAKPDDLPVELTSTGPRRSELRASN